MSQISPLKVLKSAAGFYLGRTLKKDGMEMLHSRMVGYHKDKKDAEKELAKHFRTQDKRYKEIEMKLSVEHGVNLKQSDKSQYIIALDNRQGFPVVMEIPPIKEGQEPRVKIDGKDVGKLIEVIDSNYTTLRQAPEVNRVYQALEKEADRSASSKVLAGIVDFSNRIVTSQQFDMNRKNDPDKRRFVELAVTNFHKCVLLTKDEFERSRIVGEEVSISKDRSDLGRAPQVEKELER